MTTSLFNTLCFYGYRHSVRRCGNAKSSSFRSWLRRFVFGRGKTSRPWVQCCIWARPWSRTMAVRWDSTKIYCWQARWTFSPLIVWIWDGAICLCDQCQTLKFVNILDITKSVMLKQHFQTKSILLWKLAQNRKLKGIVGKPMWILHEMLKNDLYFWT